MTGVGVSIMWCESVRQSVARYQAIDVWPVGGPVDLIAQRAQRADAFVLVMVANQLQRSLDAPGLRHLRRRLPHVDLYRLRCLYEHGDERAERKYRDKVGPNAWWRSGPADRRDGTHHHVSPEHLPRYLAEFDFRYSTRKDTVTARMQRLMGQAGGRRLTYRSL